jgi:hypothetical protein
MISAAEFGLQADLLRAANCGLQDRKDSFSELKESVIFTPLWRP